MKKFLLTTISAIVYLLTTLFAGIFFTPTFAPSPKLAQAEDTPVAGSYACILHEDTYLNASPDETQGLFLLPATYYVKLLDFGGGYCRVEYLYDDAQTKKIIGYVQTELLTFVDYIPKRPYFYYTFDLHYRIEDGLTTSSDFLNEITLSCTYYGDYKIGSKLYCYVLRGDSFGYVPKPTDLVISENTEYAEHLAQTSTEPPDETPTEQTESSPAQIAILVALCLLVPVLAALILKPPRRPPYEIDGE